MSKAEKIRQRQQAQRKDNKKKGVGHGHDSRNGPHVNKYAATPSATMAEQNTRIARRLAGGSAAAEYSASGDRVTSLERGFARTISNRAR